MPVSEGTMDEFAGHVFFVHDNRLCSRVLNPNVEYVEGGADVWRHSKTRYQGGDQYVPKQQRRGALKGHLARVLDHSNVGSLNFVAFDVLHIWHELALQGWRQTAFLKTLKTLFGHNEVLHYSLQPIELLLSQKA